MLENLFKSWSLICFGVQQHVYNILDLCFKKKKQIIIDLSQIFTVSVLKITASSLRKLRVAISWYLREIVRNPKNLILGYLNGRIYL